jgi:hypothetical protein
MTTLLWKDEEGDHVIEDGFRDRKKRPKGWLKDAIARGEVRDPDVEYVPEVHSRAGGNVIVEAPTARATVRITE